MYLDFADGLARERGAQMPEEVARIRLGTRSTRAARSDRDGGARAGGVARVATLAAALFGAHPAS